MCIKQMLGRAAGGLIGSAIGGGGLGSAIGGVTGSLVEDRRPKPKPVLTGKKRVFARDGGIAPRSMFEIH